MLDDHQVVAALDLGDQAGGVPLGLQGVHGDDPAGQAQSLDGRGELRNLVRLRADFPLGHRAALAHVEGRQQVDAAAVRAGRAADGLAVHGGLRQQAGDGGLPRLRGGASLLPLVPGRLRQRIRGSLRDDGEVAVHRVVEGPGVDPGEDAAEGALGGRPHLPRPRVAAPAQSGQDLLGAAGRPVADRGRRVVPGCGERAYRQREHELQRVPAARRLARVGNPGEPVAQARPEGAVSGENGGQVITGGVSQGR